MGSRLIHEVSQKTQTGGGAKLYASPPGKKGHDSFHVSLYAIEPGGAGELDDIHIEGAARDVRDMLLAMLEVIEACGDAFVDQGDVRPDWADPKPDPRKAKKGKKPVKKGRPAVNTSSATAVLPTQMGGPLVINPAKKPVVIKPAAQKSKRVPLSKVKEVVKRVKAEREAKARLPDHDVEIDG